MHPLERRVSLLLVASMSCALPVCAQQNGEYTEQRVKEESSSSELHRIGGSALAQPKYKKRIADLGDQIQLNSSKGFISKEETETFLARQSKLIAMEEEARKKGFEKADADELERSITLLNADLFTASHKDNPVKAGQADAEVNDPNLIPAYPDKELQPGSGKVDPPKQQSPASASPAPADQSQGKQSADMQSADMPSGDAQSPESPSSQAK